MTAATQPVAAPTHNYSLTNPPPGAYFDFDEVKTDRGQTSLGVVPLLAWKDDEESIQNMIAFYGPEGVANMVNGTSLRVSVQGIARRGKDPKVNKSDEQIALDQINFRPGKREGGQSTPASRLGNQAKKAAAVANPDILSNLLKQIQEKNVDPKLLEALGVTEEQLYAVPASANGDEDSAEGQQDQ